MQVYGNTVLIYNDVRYEIERNGQRTTDEWRRDRDVHPSRR
jgi:hypothetical protein